MLINLLLWCVLLKVILNGHFAVDEKRNSVGTLSFIQELPIVMSARVGQVDNINSDVKKETGGFILYLPYFEPSLDPMFSSLQQVSICHFC